MRFVFSWLRKFLFDFVYRVETSISGLPGAGFLLFVWWRAFAFSQRRVAEDLE